jgi:hypothetical protein
MRWLNKIGNPIAPAPGLNVSRLWLLSRVSLKNRDIWCLAFSQTGRPSNNAPVWHLRSYTAELQRCLNAGAQSNASAYNIIYTDVN